ncbi:BTB domain-containing protein [Caenorhabditis elegans]|uniref:BTB domain-containing protein n=1 Tax=Caenorhabditis elegans TaxID=6239 RepID=O17253_CAEEL|nr:BTB domain-containing protein [Caenorhabditis elegans]CCD63501.1 BTB domain-containing protein [Caenorhabditis elegans]|eukprot:NP_493902.1 BTB (Broad/complex/Tramtrack/Bric a brac) domain protein [Caenorhabditis elegans]
MDNIVTQNIKFESEPNYYLRGYHLFDISPLNGLKCEITDEFETDKIHLKIKLDWDQQEIKKITGFIQLSYDGHQLKPIDSNFDKRGGICIMTVPKYINAYRWSFSFDLKLHRYPAKPPQISHDLNPQVRSYDTMFEPSRKHDAVLLIGEKKLHVNKAFLSYHSDYFCDLFAEKFDEKNGIPIENVTYENFGLLMSIIYPEAAFSNHQNAEVLLELGNRFKIPAVMRHVENQIIRDTKFPNERLIFLADKYELQKLLAMEIQKMESFDQAKKFKGSDDYSQLSDATKAKILDRLIELS